MQGLIAEVLAAWREAERESTEPEAESLLRRAEPWRPQPSSTRRDYEDRLSQVAARWPALDDLVNDPRLVGRRK